MEETSDGRNQTIRSGYNHTYNGMKAKMTIGAMIMNEYHFTANTLADFIGEDRKRVRDLLSHYHRHHYRYFRRLKKKAQDGSYRYKLTRFGIHCALQYKKRIRLGFDLNLTKRYPTRTDTYIVLNDRGVSIGMTQDDVPKLTIDTLDYNQ